MKTTLLALVCGLSLLSAMATANPLCPTPMLVGWDQWPPYHYRDDQGVLQGYAVEVLQRVMQKMDCQLQFRERPWRRQLQELRQGEAHIAMEAYYNEDRAKYALYSDAYNPSTVTLWVRPEQQIQAPNIGALLATGFLLGITKDFFYGPEFEPYRHQKNIETVLAEETNYAKLHKGRIDGFLGDLLATTWGLKQHHMEHNVKAAPLTIYSAPAFFMFSKRSVSPEFVDRFNQALRQMKKSGEYQKILDRYTRLN